MAPPLTARCGSAACTLRMVASRTSRNAASQASSSESIGIIPAVPMVMAMRRACPGSPRFVDGNDGLTRLARVVDQAVRRSTRFQQLGRRILGSRRVTSDDDHRTLQSQDSRRREPHACRSADDDIALARHLEIHPGQLFVKKLSGRSTYSKTTPSGERRNDM